MKWAYLKTPHRFLPEASTREERAKSFLIIVTSILMAVGCLAACSTVETNHTEKTPGALEPGEFLGVTLVLDYVGGSPAEAAKLEAKLSECVHQALLEAGQEARLVPPDEFRRFVFPGLDITSAPRSTESLVSLLKASEFRQRIGSLRLRYLICVREESSSRSEVVGGSGGPAGFFIVVQEKRTNVTARIIDMKDAGKTSFLSATSESTGFYGIVVFLPIIVPPTSESVACQNFGREVVKSIMSSKE